MCTFSSALAAVFREAELHTGFIWRIPDDQAAEELTALGHDELMSATVSLWRSVEDLRDFTFNSSHGQFVERKTEWFETVAGPQLVIWDVGPDTRPGFAEAFTRPDHLRDYGASPHAYGCPY